MQIKPRYVAIILLYVTALLLLYATRAMDAMSIRSYCRTIVVPLAFWSITILYLSIMHAASFGRHGGVRVTLLPGMVLGFFANLYIALLDLIISIRPNHSFLSSYYFYYIVAVALVATFAISFSAALMSRALDAHRTKSDRYRFMLFSPLFIIPAVFVGIYRTALGTTLSLAILTAYLVPLCGAKTGLIRIAWERVTGLSRFIYKDRNLIVCIFVAAFLVRCFFAVNVIQKTESGGANRFILASDDGDGYDRHALQIARDPAGTIGKEVKLWGGYYDFGYAIFLGTIYKVFGRNFYAVTLTQSLIGAFLPVLVFLTGRAIFSKGTGALAAIALVLKNPIVFLSVVLGHESLWLSLLCLFIFMLTLYYRDQDGGYPRAALAGAALGIVCVFRGLFINLIPFAALWMILLWSHKKIKERLAGAGIFALSAILIIMTASVVFKSPLSGGSKERLQSIWELNHLYDQFQGIGNDQLMNIGINFSRDAHGALLRIASDPFTFIKVAARIYPLRVVGYYSAHQFGYFDLLYLINSAKYPNSFMSSLEFYFTLFFIYGLILCVRDRRLIRSPIFLMLAFITIVFAIIFIHITPRQRSVSTPFVYIVGSYGLVDIARRIRAKNSAKIPKDIS